MNMSEVIGLLVTLAAVWHLIGFALGPVYIHFSIRSLLGLAPYDPSWARGIRTADLHLWLSGLTLIVLGIWQKGFELYLSNPKLWCKVTVVLVWLASTQAMRHYGLPRLARGDRRPMLRLSAVNIACWTYGVMLGCAKPLAYGVWSYPQFLSGFALTGALCFIGLKWLEGRALQARPQRAGT